MLLVVYMLQMLLLLWLVATPATQMSVRKQLRPLQPPDTHSNTASNTTTADSHSNSNSGHPTGTQAEAGVAVGGEDGSPSTSPPDAEHSSLRQLTSSQHTQHQETPEVQGPHGFPRSANVPSFDLRSTTGDLGLDFLLAGLSDSAKGDQKGVMARLKSMMVDGSEDTLAMAMVRMTPAGRKKVLSTDHPEGHPDHLEDQDHLHGQSEGLHHQDPQLEDNLQGQLEGQLGSQLAPQQMAEFTLEPHLGPAIVPFEVPEGYFVPFLPRRAFGVVNGVSRPPHGHGSFYVHRPPGLVDVPNSPAFGFLFSGYRRFQPDALPRQE
ncbi:uncharacterized protein [Panulirus ornatus]|uniref:uncharacterized protein isoform X1 n=2 Tax=Panulirus ornatus TaxID=150431 RepID=UPI003A88DD6B